MIGNILQEFLTSLDNDVRRFSYCEQMYERLSTLSNWADLVIADFNHQSSKYPSDIEKIHARFPAIPIVLVTSTDGIMKAKKAVKNGVFGYLHKPLCLSELELLLHRISEISLRHDLK